jgi:hypothetical protein
MELLNRRERPSVSMTTGGRLENHLPFHTSTAEFGADPSGIHLPFEVRFFGRNAVRCLSASRSNEELIEMIKSNTGVTRYYGANATSRTAQPFPSRDAS